MSNHNHNLYRNIISTLIPQIIHWWKNIWKNMKKHEMPWKVCVTDFSQLWKNSITFLLIVLQTHSWGSLNSYTINSVDMEMIYAFKLLTWLISNTTFLFVRCYKVVCFCIRFNEDGVQLWAFDTNLCLVFLKKGNASFLMIWCGTVWYYLI